MVPRLVCSLLLGLAAAAAGAAPQTYKWVDAKGVVNYSDAPPAQAAARVRTVEERISVIGPDPSVGLAAAAMREREARRAEYEEREWQQRKSALQVQQPSASSASCVYGPDCGVSDYPEIYYPYYYYPAYGYRYGGGRLAGRLRPHPVPYVHKGPALRTRGVAMHGGGHGGAHAARAGGHGSRGSFR
jgi:hypothetical protein